jgi:hypothetical protein
MSGYWRTPALVCLALFWFCESAWAQKVDVVRLKNGDRLTCEITSLNRSMLSISTDPLGNVAIHWGQVDGLESPRPFTVQLASGERYFGPLIASSSGNVIINLGAGSSVTLALADVVQLMPILASVLRRRISIRGQR